MIQSEKVKEFFTENIERPVSLSGDDKRELERALLEALEGIKTDLVLSQKDLCKVLHIPEATYNGWKEKGSINLSNSQSLNDLGIIKFIDLYDSISSLYSSKDGYLNWFQSPLASEKSPIELMIDDSEQILHLNTYVNWLLNP
jgi:uncharacterized protein (DUF2384 family)